MIATPWEIAGRELFRQVEELEAENEQLRSALRVAADDFLDLQGYEGQELVEACKDGWRACTAAIGGSDYGMG